MPTQNADSDNAANDVRRYEQMFQNAFNNNDFETMVNFFTPEATLIPPNRLRCEGQSEIEKFCREFKNAGASDLYLEQGTIFESVDFVAHQGQYRLTLAEPGGGTRPDSGNYIAVYRRQSNGELRCVLHTFNSELPH